MISISVTIVPLVTFSYFLKCSFLLLSFLNTWSIMFLVWPSGEVHDISPMILHMYGSINLFVFSIYLITYMYVTTLLFINHQPCLAINANFSSCWDKDFNSKGRKTSRILWFCYSFLKFFNTANFFILFEKMYLTKIVKWQYSTRNIAVRGLSWFVWKILCIFFLLLLMWQ